MLWCLCVLTFRAVAAHTCFFSVELPRYSSEAVMRERLLYACAEGVAIDADWAVRDASAWAEAPAAPRREADDEAAAAALGD